ncbi:MAG: hypothetical protein EA001_03860 [Oscillatoriales cyanobacterium]|nr:MAG: hypothetical protein EA001_03860 [Oscillatoriales cyanobacterium]
MAIAPKPVLTRPTAPRLRSLPQTYGAISVALGGWAGLLLWRGLRPVVWLGGAIATGIMLGWWVLEVRRLPLPQVSEDLLDTAGLDQQLVALEPLAGQSATAQRLWATVVQEMRSLRMAAADIAQRDSSLVPDLYEAIVTGLGLAEQAMKATAAIETVQTAAYRDRARSQQQEAIGRLNAACTAMTELRDSLVLGEIATQDGRSSLPARLSLIVEENRAALQRQSSS